MSVGFLIRIGNRFATWFGAGRGRCGRVCCFGRVAQNRFERTKLKNRAFLAAYSDGDGTDGHVETLNRGEVVKVVSMGLILIGASQF